MLLEINVATAVFQVGKTKNSSLVPKSRLESVFWKTNPLDFLSPIKLGRTESGPQKHPLSPLKVLFASDTIRRAEHSATIGRKDVCFCIAKPEFCGSLAIRICISATFFVKGRDYLSEPA